MGGSNALLINLLMIPRGVKYDELACIKADLALLCETNGACVLLDVSSVCQVTGTRSQMVHRCASLGAAGGEWPAASQTPCHSNLGTMVDDSPTSLRWNLHRLPIYL